MKTPALSVDLTTAHWEDMAIQLNLSLVMAAKQSLLSRLLLNGLLSYIAPKGSDCPLGTYVFWT